MSHLATRIKKLEKAILGSGRRLEVVVIEYGETEQEALSKRADIDPEEPCLDLI